MNLTSKDLVLQFAIYLVIAIGVAYLAEVYFRPKGQMRLEKMKAKKAAKQAKEA